MPQKIEHTAEELREIASRLTLQYIQHVSFNNNVKCPKDYAEYYLKTEKDIYETLSAQE